MRKRRWFRGIAKSQFMPSVWIGSEGYLGMLAYNLLSISFTVQACERSLLETILLSH